MKYILLLFIIFSFTAQNLYAWNACWDYSSNMYYTHKFKDAVYPGWGSTLYPYFDNVSPVYNGNYSGTPPCGEINVNNAGVWTQGGGTCFITIGGVTSQGNLGTINYSSFVQCAVPLDDHLPILIISIVGLSAFYIAKKNRLNLN